MKLNLKHVIKQSEMQYRTLKNRVHGTLIILVITVIEQVHVTKKYWDSYSQEVIFTTEILIKGKTKKKENSQF